MIWNTENNFKENILNVFGITDLQQYEEDTNIVDDFAIDCPNGANYCFICYSSLETVIKNQIKMCVNDKCDALYHMACICAVNIYLFYIYDINNLILDIYYSN